MDSQVNWWTPLVSPQPKTVKVRSKMATFHTCGEGQQRSNTHSTTHTTNTEALLPVRIIVYLGWIIMWADTFLLLWFAAHTLQSPIC